MARVAIYARQSKTRQDSNSPSIEVQIENCQRAAARSGDEVVAIYQDKNAPADRWDLRKDWDRLMDDASQETFTKVYADARDRLWRDDEPWRLYTKELAEYGITHIVTPSSERTTNYEDDPEAEFSDGLDVMIAKRENRMRAKRVRDQRRKYANEGKPHVTRTRPFGLSHDWSTIIDEEAAVIKEMASRILSGDSPNNIANDLNARGIRPTGKVPKHYRRKNKTDPLIPRPNAGQPTEWQAGTVTDLLQQPRLIGKRVHKGKVTVRSEHIPAILDETTFRRVGSKLSVKQRRTRTDYLLSSMLTCEKCGFTLWSRPGDNRAYCCPSPKTSSTRGQSCGKMFITAKKTEDQIRRYIINKLEDGFIDDVIDLLQQTDNEDEVAAAREALKLATEKRDALKEQLTSGQWDDPTIILSAIEAQNARVREQQAIIDRYQPRQITLPDAWKLPPVDWHQWWDDASLRAQQKMMRLIIASITVKPSTVHWKQGTEDRLVIVPREIDDTVIGELADLAVSQLPIIHTQEVSPSS